MNSPDKKFPPYLSLLSGALMGTADAVPGVSGGTIALIIGIYDRFINSLSTMVKSPALIIRKDGRQQITGALMFLGPLAIGLVAAYYIMTKILVGPVDAPGLLRRDSTGPACFAFFFGLVLISLREPWRRIKGRTASHYVLAAFGAISAFLFVGLPYAGQQDPAAWMLILGGAGAISVMLLPGVSGSLFLLIVGLYQPVAGAVHDRSWSVLAIFVIGIGVGIIAFVPMLKVLLEKAHDMTMASLTGLMAGSLRALWPWKSSYNYDPKAEPMHNVGVGDGIVVIIIAAAVGGAVVWLLAKLEHRVLAIDSEELES